MEPTPLGADQPIGPDQTPPPADRSAQVGQMGRAGQAEAPTVGTGRAPVTQQTEGEGRAVTHTHPPITHTHDHYHVTHHHRGGILGEWEHRTHWHTHEHNHAGLTHSHDYGREEEEQEHNKESHIHDHTSPAQSPA